MTDPYQVNSPYFRLEPASSYTVEQLTEGYNQTRIDYIVPMPMNVRRMKEYIRTYDIDLSHSVVAVNDERILGLAMLGVRDTHTWVTRLGVVPTARRHGTGYAMMHCLVQNSRVLKAEQMALDVIKNNDPAYYLFRKIGFQETRELLILRRPPGAPEPDLKVPGYSVSFHDTEGVIRLLAERSDKCSWLTETASMQNAGNLMAISVETENGDAGWLAYESTIFQLARLVPHTLRGDPATVSSVLFHALHTHHPIQDTKVENVDVNDPHLEGYYKLGYFESFRRIEMKYDLVG